MSSQRTAVTGRAFNPANSRPESQRIRRLKTAKVSESLAVTGCRTCEPGAVPATAGAGNGHGGPRLAARGGRKRRPGGSRGEGRRARNKTGAGVPCNALSAPPLRPAPGAPLGLAHHARWRRKRRPAMAAALSASGAGSQARAVLADAV